MQPAATRPPVRRSRAIHWAAFVAASAAFALLVIVLSTRPDEGTLKWLGRLDIALSVAFALEFFTRSGLRNDPKHYAAWRWFDFVAMMPAVFILAHDVPANGFLAWAFVLTRGVRTADRLLGDGFVQRNVLIVADGVLEEISDRVILRIMDRIEAELEDGRFGAAAAEVLTKNKAQILARISAEQMREGLAAKVADLAGLRARIEKEEEHIFDAIVAIVASEEIDRTIRETISTTLDRARGEIGESTWRSKLGFGPRVVAGHPPATRD